MTPAKPKTKKNVEETVETAKAQGGENVAAETAEPTHTHELTHNHSHDHDHTHAHTHGIQMNEACRREVKVEVTAAEVTAQMETTLRKYQKFARIPGFRPGKAPLSAVKFRYMDDARSEVVEALVSKHYRVALDSAKLNHISQPNLKDLKFTDGEPMSFTAEFEIMPEFKVEHYKELKAEKQTVTVEEKEVEAALTELQERQSSYDPVEDRELKDGDFAVASFTGQPKGLATIVAKKAEIAAKKAKDAGDESAEPNMAAVPPAENVEPIELKEVLVEIGGANTVKEFSENLRGAKTGEERKFDVTYAEDYTDKRLAGHVLHYTAKVEGIKKKIMPDLNDDFAKQLGEFATLDELRKRIRENMESEKKHAIEHTAKEKLVDELVAKNPIEVPQTLVEKQIDIRLERGFRALAAQGMSMEQLKQFNMSQLRIAQQNAALREVKASVLLDKLADQEKIEISEADLQKEFEIAAAQMQIPIEEVRRRLTENQGIERMKDRLRNEKALDLLYQQ